MTDPETLVPPPDVAAQHCGACGALLDDDALCDCGWEPTEHRLGAIVSGKYRIEAVIGCGAMGCVYSALNLALGEAVAVKFLSRRIATTVEGRLRMEREAVALGRLRHPGIVSVLDFGVHEDSPFLVMELLEGVTLTALLSTERALPERRAAWLFEQILDALASAHALAVVHRDIKPDNVMVVADVGGTERAKVLDFGLALVREGAQELRLTQVGTVPGTPLYMSPEQCQGHAAGPAADIYAVGVMLFEALAGRPPFDGSDPVVLMALKLMTNAPRLADVAPAQAISPVVEAAVRWALAPDPAQRPTATELRDVLRALLAARRSDEGG